MCISVDSYGLTYTLEDNFTDSVYLKTIYTDNPHIFIRDKVYGFFDLGEIWALYEPGTVKVNKADAHFLFTDDTDPITIKTNDTGVYFDYRGQEYIRKILYAAYGESEQVNTYIFNEWQAAYPMLFHPSWPTFREDYIMYDETITDIHGETIIENVHTYIYDDILEWGGEFSTIYHNLSNNINIAATYNKGIVDFSLSTVYGDFYFERGYLELDIDGTLIQANPVPEPATILLLGSGLAGLAFYRRKRK